MSLTLAEPPLEALPPCMGHFMKPAGGRECPECMFEGLCFLHTLRREGAS